MYHADGQTLVRRTQMWVTFIFFHETSFLAPAGIL